MYTIMKQRGTQVCAYELGKPHPVLAALQQSGELLPLENGDFEIFSQEAVHGKGEVAHPGDFLKLDSKGHPYPNSRSFFLENHRHIQGDLYEQHPKPLIAWDLKEPYCEEIDFLIRCKGLVLTPQDRAQSFTAPLWGTVLSAGADAVLVFYRLDRREDGAVEDADYNLVERAEFEKNYRRL